MQVKPEFLHKKPDSCQKTSTNATTFKGGAYENQTF